MFLRSLVMVGLLSGVAAGQSAGSAAAATVLVAPPGSEGCPVGLAVQRRAEGRLFLAGRGSGAGAAQRLSVEFVRHETPQLVSAEGVAHGPARGGGAMLMMSGIEAAATEPFSAMRGVGEAGLGRSSISLSRLAGVSWIELTKIQYADGTTWQALGPFRCVAEPNGLLLVTAH